MDSVDILYLGLIGALIICASVVFLRVQIYLADPLRQERNEQWFAQFEAYLRQRYRDRDLQWRTQVLEMQFRDRRPIRTGQRGGGGSGGFSNALL